MMRNLGRRGQAMHTGPGLMDEEPTIGASMKRMMAGIGSGRLRDSRMQQQPRSLLDTHDYQDGMMEQRNMGAEKLDHRGMRDKSPYGREGRMEQSNEMGYYDKRGDTNRYMEEQTVYQQEYNHQSAGKYGQKEYGHEHYENTDIHFDYNHGIKSSQEVDAYRESDYNHRRLKQRPDKYKDQSINQRAVLGKPPATGSNVEMPRLFDELFRPGLADQYNQRGNREQPREPGSLLEMPHEERDIISQSMEHQDYLQQEHQHDIVEMPRERGHVDSSREHRSHVDSLRERHGMMEPPREQHGHMDSLKEQRGLMKPQREQREHIYPARDKRGLVESPWEEHGFLAMQREQRGLMEPPREHRGPMEPPSIMELGKPPMPPRGLMDSSREPRSIMDTPMNQRGLMNPSMDARDQRGIPGAHRDQRGIIDAPRDQTGPLDFARQHKGMSKDQRMRQNKQLKPDLQMKLLMQQEKLREHEQMEQLKLIEQQEQEQLQVKMEQQQKIKQQLQQVELIIARKQGSRGGGGSIPSLFALPAHGKRPAPPSRISDNKRPRTVSEERQDRRPPSVPERRRSPINRSIEQRQRDRNRRTQFSSPAMKQDRKDSGYTRNATSKPAATSKNRGEEGRARDDKGKGKDDKGKSRYESNKSKGEKKKNKDEKGKDKVQPNTEVILIVDDELYNHPVAPTEDAVVMSADRRDRRPPSVPERRRSPINRSIERQRDRNRRTRSSSPAKRQDRNDSGSTTNSTSKPATTRNDMIVKGRAGEHKGKGKDEKGKSRDESNKHKDEKEKNKYEKGEDKKQLKTEVIVIVDEQYDPTESTEDDVVMMNITPIGTKGPVKSILKTDRKPMKVECITPVKPEVESVVPEIYDPSVAVGQRYIVSGFFCKLCQKFYNNIIATQISHCQSQTHYEKLKNTLATKPAKVDVTSNKSEIGHPLFKTGEESEDNDKGASKEKNMVESRNQSMNESVGETIVINMNIK